MEGAPEQKQNNELVEPSEAYALEELLGEINFPSSMDELTKMKSEPLLHLGRAAQAKMEQLARDGEEGVEKMALCRSLIEDVHAAAYEMTLAEADHSDVFDGMSKEVSEVLTPFFAEHQFSTDFQTLKGLTTSQLQGFGAIFQKQLDTEVERNGPNFSGAGQELVERLSAAHSTVDRLAKALASTNEAKGKYDSLWRQANLAAAA